MTRVLHLSHFEDYGGSARSATNIHRGLRELGVDSRMLVGVKDGHDPDVAPLRTTRAVALVDKVIHRSALSFGVQYPADIASFRLTSHAWFREADVLQLFNIHGGWFAHTVLPRLAARKPVVWRLSDMWAMTGHCGYSYACERWRTGCGNCPNLAEYPGVPRDATALNWRVKRRIYARTDLVIVAPSRWIAERAKESPLLGRYRVEVVPNGVDTEFFAAGRRAEARERFGLAAKEKVVLISSLQARKGGEIVLGTLALAARETGGVTALVMGPRERPPAEHPGVRIVDLGVVEDPATVRDAYAAADLMLQPTLADNLPNTVLESMSSGTPVVAVARGGLADAITDGVDGRLAAEPSASELCRLVCDVLADDGDHLRMADRARATAEGRFSLRSQAMSILGIYDEILGNAGVSTSGRR